MASVITLDPAGDAIFAISGNQDGDPRYQVRVSTKVLTLASPVFGAMFGLSFKEKTMLESAHADGQPATLEFKEDFPEAMVRLLSILHFRGHEIDRPTTHDEDSDSNGDDSDSDCDPLGEDYIQMVAAVAIQADKFGLTEAIGSWMVQAYGKFDNAWHWPTTSDGTMEKVCLMIIAQLFPKLSISEDIKSFLEIHLTPKFSLQGHEGLLRDRVNDSFLETLRDEVKDTLNEMREIINMCLDEAGEPDFDDSSNDESNSAKVVHCPSCRLPFFENKTCSAKTGCRNQFSIKCSAKMRRRLFVQSLAAWDLAAVLARDSQALYAMSPKVLSDRFQRAHAELSHECAQGKNCPLVFNFLQASLEVKARAGNDLI